MYVNDDYIGVDGKNFKFYYGYDVLANPDKNEDEDEIWCFRSVINGKETIIPWTELGTNDMLDMTGNLGAGIKRVLDQLLSEGV